MVTGSFSMSLRYATNVIKTSDMPDLPLYDNRMLQVVAHFKQQGIPQRDFLASIGLSANNIYQIKEGKVSFKIYHLEACIKLYKVNPAYFFKEKAGMFEGEKQLKSTV